MTEIANTELKKKPVKSSNKEGQTVVKKDGVKSKARAFINWFVPYGVDKRVVGSKGFPVYPPNADFPNPQEDWLVEMAKEAGGTLDLTMHVRVQIVNDEAVVLPTLSDIFAK